MVRLPPLIVLLMMPAQLMSYHWWVRESSGHNVSTPSYTATPLTPTPTHNISTDSPKWVQVISSPSNGIMEGDTVNLTCNNTTTYYVNSYIWYKRSGSEDIQIGYEQNYTITNINITDNSYKCWASSYWYGSQMSDYKTLEVFYSPKNVRVSISPSAGIMEGGSVNLTCSGDANPRVGSYTWFKRSGTEDVEVGSEQSYTISNITITDHNYKCRASNQHGSAFSDYKTLEVFYSPKNVQVSISPSAGIMEGGSANLTCSGDANPRVGKYTWFKRSGTEDVEVGSEQSYTISNIAITDHNYKCRASNQHGSAFSDYKTLEVFYSPKNVRVSISPSAGIMEGGSVNLTCSGDANPRVGSYTWFKRSGTEDVEVGSEQSYTISNITITDHNYKCRADNQHGSALSDYKTPNVLYSPKNVQVSISPSAGIMEGGSVNLTCSGDANPRVGKYTWFKRSGTEDVEVGSEQSYTISNITITDHNYKCRASNQHGSAFSDNKTLEVFYSPKNVQVSISPSAGIMEGGSVNLTCSGDANPRVGSYTWFKRSGTEDVEVGSEQSYTISNIAITDHNYKCRADNQHGSAFSDYKTLQVFYSPKNVRVSISPSAGIMEGGSVTLTCSGDANPRVGKYTWFKRSGTEDVEVGSEQSYTISNIAITDHNYKCRASNQHGSAFSDYKTLEVFYSPKNVQVSISPSAGIMEGGSANLTCSGDANPRVGKYTWFKRSGTEDVEVGSEQSYTISNIAITDHNYKCRASNQHGSAFSDYKTLEVFYSPKNVRVSISPSAGIMEGGSVNLTCSGDANPRVGSYTWFKRSGTEDVEVGSEQSYTISNITITDHNYKCRADNQHGSALSDYKTPNVLYSPKNVQVSISPSAGIMEGGSVNLTCSGDANPRVGKYTWFKRSGTEDVEVGSEQSYTISNITITDHNYKCRASNQHGSAFSDNKTLEVFYSPKNVQVSISPSAGIMEGGSVNLTCSGDANPRVGKYTWFKRSGTEDVEVGSEQSYTISNITITDHNYKCRASNQHGSAFSDNKTLEVFYSPKNVQVSISPSAGIMEGGSVNLTCSGDANPRVGKYTWFKRSGTEDVEVGSEQSYTISNIAITDHNYKCRADNQHGSAFSDYKTLEVFYSTKNVQVSISPSAGIMEGGSVNLTCSGDANPRVGSYTWFKRSGTVDVEVGSEQSYTISNITITDHNYKCRADNQHGSAFSDYKTLEVFYSPKNVQVSISPSAGIMEGGSVNLTCSGDANPRVGKYTWFKRSGTEDVEVGSEQSYTISNITITDHNYKCRADNQHGSAFSDYKTLEVFYSPKNVRVSISPSAGIMEGGSVTLTCSGDANPRVGKYTWFKRSGTEDVEVGSEQSYTISNIAITDHNYKCRASNQHGSAFSDYKTLEVFYSPKNVRVSISPSAGIMEGGSVNLTCSGDANPRVGSYTWFKRSGTEDVEVGSEQSYTISNIAITDNYRCRADNQHGSAFSDYKTPNVLYSPKKASVSVTLICRANGNPPVKYTWFKEGESTPVADQPSYSITNISKEDVARFYCKAGNAISHQYAVSQPVTCVEECPKAQVAAAGLGGFCGGLVTAALFYVLWMGRKKLKMTFGKEARESRRKQGKKTTVQDDYENVDPESKDDTYTTLNTKTGLGNDFYETLTTRNSSTYATTQV